MINELTSSMAGYLAAYVALLMLLSAAHKLTHHRRADAAAAQLLPLGNRFARFAWVGAATIEITSAIAILLEETRQLGAWAAASLWGAYSCAIAVAALRGRDFDCGCSFAAQRAHSVSFSIGRSSMLCATALLLAAATHALDRVALGAMELLGGLAFLTLYVALDLATPLPSQESRA